MNLILTGLVVQNLVGAEEIVDEFLVNAGIEPESVKKRVPVEKGSADGVAYSFRQQGLFSTIIRIGWISDSSDEELGARGVLMIETALCYTPSNPHTLLLSLSYNNSLRSPVRVALLGQGRFLGTDLVADISTISRGDLERVIHEGLFAGGAFFNCLTGWDSTVKPLGQALEKNEDEGVH